MKQPVIKVPKKGKSIDSKKVEDFLVYTRFNTLKVFNIYEGETVFTAHSQVNKYEYRHNLGYKPMVFGFFTGCYGIGIDTKLTEDIWYPMNTGEIGYTDNKVLGAWEYNDIANSGTPSGAGGDNDSTEYITVLHYHYAEVGGGTNYLPVTSKYKLLVFGEPEKGAWF